MTELLLETLKNHQPSFHPVVRFDHSKDKLLPIDITDQNTELTDEILSDFQKFSDHIYLKLNTANARFGFGGYAEHRKVYHFHKVFDPSLTGEEPRRFHLGTDIWGKPHTPVMAPLNGIVHSFAFNDNHGDYGATIILTHQLDGIVFHTLYGHLSLNDLKNLEEGQRIEKGDIFCEFGIPADNGHWPPHLHFQIIIDLEGKSGDYPGVCAFSQRHRYLQNCPDPDLILNMNRFI